MGMLKSRGGATLCPYCLNNYSGETKGVEHRCSTCRTRLPREFVEDNLPKATVGLVGFSGHGKTVFLTSLFYLLKKQLSDQGLWQGFYLRSLDDNTHKIIHEDVPLFADHSTLPDATPENFPYPALIRFSRVPFYEEWFLCFYDTAGEVYEEVEKITNQGRFVAHSSTVLFVISLADCNSNSNKKDWRDRWPDNSARLLDIYIRAVKDHLGVKLKEGQHLIVVLTKGDLLVHNFLPGGLVDHLRAGSVDGYLDIGKGGVSQLRGASRAIGGWLEEHGGAGFVNMARDNFKSVEYTLVSSTGAAPVGKKLVSKLTAADPKRVLDPFLWVLEKHRRKGIWERFSGK